VPILRSDTNAAIDAGSPVEWGHPLNAGRLAWWLALPGGWSTSAWPDLIGGRAGSFSGTRNAAAHPYLPGAAGWTGGGTASATVGALTSGLSRFTFSATFHRPSTSDLACMGRSGTNARWLADVQSTFAALAAENGGYAVATAASGALGAGRYQIVVAFAAAVGGDAAQLRCYVNGVPQSVSGLTLPATTPAMTTWLFGNNGNNATSSGVVWYDGAIWSRALGASDAAALWEDTQRGYPATLRRVRGRSLVSLSGAAAQTIAAAGIAATLVLGSPVLTPGPVGLAVPGLAATTALGTPSLAVGPVTIAPAGIGSTLAVGAPVVSAGGTVLAPAGIGSTVAVGTATVAPGAVSVTPAGIGSTAAIGTPTVALAGMRFDVRQAVLARLRGSAALTAIVGARGVYPGVLPIEQRLPAVAVHVRRNPRTQGLRGCVGEAAATVTVNLASWRLADVVAAKRVVEELLDGVAWTDGGVEVTWSAQAEEEDLNEPPVDASDRWLYRTVVEYHVRVRVPRRSS
jgi:hypothetical protein